MGLQIVVDTDNRVVEIEGVRYDWDLFKAWGKNGMDVGSLFRLVKRETDGYPTIQLIQEEPKVD